MRLLAISLLPLLFFLTSAIAGITSEYTSFDLDKCQTIDKPTQPEEPWIVLGCKGYRNDPAYDIVFHEDDLRGSFSVGKNPREHCASSFSFSGFNSPGKTIEWRLSDGKPFATILRWTVSMEVDGKPREQQWLAVTKLEADNSCPAAYVEAALPMANEKAREAADRLLTGFTCGTDAIVVVKQQKTSLEGVPNGSSCKGE